MQLEARAHVPALTGVLSVVSLALVFGAVGGVLPTESLPRSEPLLALVPHLNAVISAAAIVAILSGWRWIRRGDVTRHRAAMLAAFGLFVAFLVLYLYRVSIEGATDFPGPEGVYTYVYLPLLAVHVTLAIVCIPLLYYVLLLAATRPWRELGATRHPTVGRVAAGLWLVSFSLGIVVYLLLYVVY
ncbi:DUF420 domain-containing protein [Halomarina ordinaria]|uniref:DUF420 domain-containing protein n=1 Tax=Halomarina ordinaria TaxID=3033939 RepID=A0ABD5U997_9EURY|nr:DUF420 domain-containing protein [Halomarina sp. PSRA2]